MQGYFISFEGGEGAGKSTQMRRLAERLTGLGFAVATTREPGGSPRAEAIREAVLCGSAKDFGPFAETILFTSARADHVDRVIRPALERGEVVLCDRFIDSTRIYQGALGGLDDGLLRALEAVSVGQTQPHLTLILDVPAKLGMARADQRRALKGEEADRFESEEGDFHSRVRQGFLTLAEAEPQRCAVIDAAGDPDAVEAVIWSTVAQRLPDLTRAARDEAHHGA